MRQLVVAVAVCGGLGLVAAEPAEPPPPVTVLEDQVVLPLEIRQERWRRGEFKNGSLFAGWHEGGATGQVTLARVVLENRWLAAEIYPQCGGALGRVRHRPTGADLFYWEEGVKTRLPFWESGVKASFPYPEHGVATLQPTGWRVIEHVDGARSVVMWMEFSRHIGPQHKFMFGRYSPLLLTQTITLRPAHAAIGVRYRIVNPVGYRQGRRCWNDAIFPRWDEGRGQTARAQVRNTQPTDAEWIFPVAWASDHLGNKLRRVTSEMLPFASIEPPPGPPPVVIDGKGKRRVKRPPSSLSLFAWDRQHPFVGIWYPRAGANRLRIDDPSTGPGAKLWWPIEPPPARPDDKRGLASTANIAEIWGGFDHVFEGVEQWLEPGEAASFGHHFTYTQGIGKAIFANEELVVGRVESQPPDQRGGKPNGPGMVKLTLLPLRPHAGLTIRHPDPADPRRSVTVRSPMVGPGQPFVVSVPDVDGAIIVSVGGGERRRQRRLAGGGRRVEPVDRVLARFAARLVLHDQQEHHARLSALLRSPENIERQGQAFNRGMTRSTAYGRYPDPSTGRGRVALQTGRFDQAQQQLEAVVAATPDDGEAWHLLGCLRAELGQSTAAIPALDRALQAREPYAIAAWPRAVLTLAPDGRPLAERRQQALGLLDELLAIRPRHWEARLLRTWLVLTDAKADKKQLAVGLDQLLEEDPADPRVLWLQLQARRGNGSRLALAKVLEEPGAASRLALFRASTRGLWQHPPRPTEE